MIDTYIKAKAYLDSFINYERKINFSYKKALKIERMRLLLKHLNIPYQQLKVIHIAGTKGKGSTAHFCAEILAGAGFRVGLYTSPHLFDFRERIAINTKHRIPNAERQNTQSRLISKKDVVRIVGEFENKSDKLRIPKNLGKISFFEIYTAIAFKYFLDKKVNFAVLETGLGGRLDATNVIKPLVSIITHIGYDHTDKLGKSLSSIAAEKAGIIKKGIPLVCSSQEITSLAEIKRKCRMQAAPLYLLGRDFKAKNIRLNRNYTLFDFESSSYRLRDIRINLKGKQQVQNACCAFAACFLLKSKGIIKEDSNFEKEIEGHSLRGRFEIVNSEPLVIMDIAHNDSSFSVLNDNLKFYFPSKKIILIFACAKDKQVKTMLRKIDYSHLILTKFSNLRAYDPGQIKQICKLNDAVITKDVKEAFAAAERVYTLNHAIVVSGSLFLVSEAKKFFKRLRSPQSFLALVG